MESEIRDEIIPTEEELQSDGDAFSEEIVSLNIEEEAPPEDFDVPHACKIIEAVLFAAGYPVGYNTLGKVLEISAGAAKKIVRDFAEEMRKGNNCSYLASLTTSLCNLSIYFYCSNVNQVCYVHAEVSDHVC